MCKRYTNPYGTTFITCELLNHGLLTLEPYRHYPELFIYCPYCGKKLDVTDLRNS